jgi:hypothetical protein
VHQPCSALTRHAQGTTLYRRISLTPLLEALPQLTDLVSVQEKPGACGRCPGAPVNQQSTQDGVGFLGRSEAWVSPPPQGARPLFSWLTGGVEVKSSLEFPGGAGEAPLHPYQILSVGGWPKSTGPSPRRSSTSYACRCVCERDPPSDPHIQPQKEGLPVTGLFCFPHCCTLGGSRCGVSTWEPKEHRREALASVGPCSPAAGCSRPQGHQPPHV